MIYEILTSAPSRCPKTTVRSLTLRLLGRWALYPALGTDGASGACFSPNCQHSIGASARAVDSDPGR
eukprot:5551276-Amphidinium_carterae.1